MNFRGLRKEHWKNELKLVEKRLDELSYEKALSSSSSVSTIELIARFVFRWKRSCEVAHKIRKKDRKCGIIPLAWCVEGSGGSWKLAAASYWNPSEDEGAAFQLLKHLTETDYAISFSSSKYGVICEITSPSSRVEFAEAETLQLALCRAVLLTHEKIPRKEIQEKEKRKKLLKDVRKMWRDSFAKAARKNR